MNVLEMLNALEIVGGKSALSLIEEIPDETVSSIISTWPARFDVLRARELGFQHDGSLLPAIEQYAVGFMPQTKT